MLRIPEVDRVAWFRFPEARQAVPPGAGGVRRSPRGAARGSSRHVSEIRQVSAAVARRFLALRHLLAPPRSLPPEPESVLRVVDRIGSLQFDPLEVAGRNHDLVLLARIAGYRREWTDHWLYEDRRLYETYNKSLNIVPVAELPLYRWTWDRMRKRARGRRLRRARAARRGASRPDPGRRRAAASRRRRARGDRLVLAPDQPGPRDPRGPRRGRHPRDPRGARATCASTTSPSACFPPEVLAQRHPEEEQRQHRLLARYRGHGLLGASGNQELWVGGTGYAADRAAPPGGAHRGRPAVPGPGRGPARASGSSSPRTSAFLDQAEAEIAGAGAPGGTDAGVAFLAPLDPLCWDRDLLRRLYDFDYVWEVYVPAAKRRWGYYVLPILYGDRLVGRIEPRIERRAGTLRVAGLWWEPGFDPLGEHGFVAAFAAALAAHRDFADLETVALPRETRHRPLVTAVRGALDAAGARSRARVGRCTSRPTSRPTPAQCTARRLPMAETRHATATWSGNLTEGSGMLLYISSGAFSRMPITLGLTHGRPRGQDEPGGAARRGPRELLLDGLLQPAREERHGRREARRPRRRDRRQARRRLDGAVERDQGHAASSRASTRRRSRSSRRRPRTAARSRGPSPATSSSPSSQPSSQG